MNKLLSVDQVAEYFNISRASVYRIIERRKITFYKTGGSLRFRPEDVEKYLEENKINIIK